MGHIPEDDNFDEFMNASAEEWSKPEEPLPHPSPPPEETDRWGSPTAHKEVLDDPNRWGSEAPEKPKPVMATPEGKKSSKWWSIPLVVIIVSCLCIAIACFGLYYLGTEVFEWIDLSAWF